MTKASLASSMSSITDEGSTVARTFTTNFTDGRTSGTSRSMAGVATMAPIEEDQGPKKKWPIFIVVLVGLAAPMTVFLVRSAEDRQACDQVHQDCLQHCKDIFSGLAFKYQSEMLPAFSCLADCDARDSQCVARANVGLYAGLIVAAGFGLAALMIFGMDSLMVGSTLGALSARSHPEAVEPIATEEEKASALDWTEKWKFWIQPHERKFISLEEVECIECGAKNLVDRRWLDGTHEGLDSAMCVRCHRVIAGVE